MSSIGAIFHRNGQPVDRADLERMETALDRGTAERREVLVSGPVGFVHCLRSFTPEDRFEQQPMTIADRWHVVFEGRIDNREELAHSIGIGRDHLRDMADGALFLAAIERRELDVVERIVGEFAGILFDRHSRELVVFRDHIGLHSLVYYADDDFVAVATTLAGLFALPRVPRNIDYTNLADRMAGASWNVEGTDYVNVFSVLPAHIHTFGARGQRRRRYWNLADHPKVHFRRHEEYIEAFTDVFTTAVRAQTRAVGNVGAQVTGGLDSSSVAVMAASVLREQGATLYGFTAVPEEGFRKAPTGARYFDETELVTAIARMTPNLEPEFVRPDPRPILERIDETIRLHDSSFTKVLNTFWGEDILQAARQKGVRVLLNGEAGNNTMSYAGRIRFAELFLRGRWLSLWRELRPHPPRVRKGLIRIAIIGPLLPGWFYRRWRDRYSHGAPIWSERTYLRPAFGMKHRVEERAAEAGFDLRYLPTLDEHRSRMDGVQGYADSALSLAVERAVYGIDARSPTLDRRVVAYTLGVPTSVFMRDGVERRLIRDAMRGLLPDAVRLNDRIGEQAVDWFPRLGREADAWKGILDRADEDEDLREMFDLPRLRGVLAKLTGAPEPVSGTLEAFAMSFSLPRAIGVARFVTGIKRK